MKYNKLVRDKIPQIITDSGKQAICEVLSQQEYIKMLEKKLSEELNEYMESKELEELADLLEVIYSLASVKGSSMVDLERLRCEKSAERGGFTERILLKEVVD